MKELTAEQLAQRIYDCGLMSTKDLEVSLADAGGRDRASFNDFIMTLLEKEQMTNWQISRVVDGQRRGYFYGDWKVLYLVGAGTFARVYRSAHRTTGEVKAVKVLRQRYSNDIETRESFLREAKMVMKLRHPNIVPIYEVDEDNGRIYMVMDFVEGQNLREYVKAHRKIPHLTALKITRDIAAGLALAANHNINHRDMKLSNVLLSANGQAKIVDFGLATVAGDKGAEGKAAPRSIDYAGLERTTGVRRDDKRSDIYFVGCMLYHMVTGAPALSETKERIKRLASNRYTDVVPVTVLDPEMPHRIVVLIHRLMELNAEKRIQTPELVNRETESVIRAIEAGDVKRYDENLTEQEAKEYADMQAKHEEGQGKTLLLIESNVSVQDSLRGRLKDIGYRVLITADLERGLSRFENLDPADDLPADCVIFGSAGLGRAAVVGFEKFVTGEFTSTLPAILIATGKVKGLVKKQWLNEHRKILLFPVKFKDVQHGLRALLGLEVDANQGKEVKPSTREPSEPSPSVNDSIEDTDVELG